MNLGLRYFRSYSIKSGSGIAGSTTEAPLIIFSHNQDFGSIVSVIMIPRTTGVNQSSLESSSEYSERRASMLKVVFCICVKEKKEIFRLNWSARILSTPSIPKKAGYEKIWDEVKNIKTGDGKEGVEMI